MEIIGTLATNKDFPITSMQVNKRIILSVNLSQLHILHKMRTVLCQKLFVNWNAGSSVLISHIFVM